MELFTGSNPTLPPKISYINFPLSCPVWRETLKGKISAPRPQTRLDQTFLESSFKTALVKAKKPLLFLGFQGPTFIST